jgi:hypothetical protein
VTAPVTSHNRQKPNNLKVHTYPFDFDMFNLRQIITSLLVFYVAVICAIEPPKELVIDITTKVDNCKLKAGKGDRIKVHYVSANISYIPRAYSNGDY